MSRVVVPNLATDWKARVGASVLALAIGLGVALATGNLGVSGIVLGGYGMLIGLVRLRQERSARLQDSPGRASNSN